MFFGFGFPEKYYRCASSLATAFVLSRLGTATGKEVGDPLAYPIAGLQAGGWVGRRRPCHVRSFWFWGGRNAVPWILPALPLSGEQKKEGTEERRGGEEGR